MSFYGTKDGNKLVDENNYPDSIKEYLKKEKELLEKYLEDYDLLIEVGCMEGRNIDVALNMKKKYIGIDIIESYISIVNEMINKRGLNSISEAFCLDANYLKRLISLSRLYKDSKSLIYFPFNSFGNMDNPNKVLSNFNYLYNSDFVIFTYDIDDYSNFEREKYYENCNYDNLRKEINEEGVRFISSNGLNTVAYDKEYLKRKVDKNP